MVVVDFVCRSYLFFPFLFYSLNFVTNFSEPCCPLIDIINLFLLWTIFIPISFPPFFSPYFFHFCYSSFINSPLSWLYHESGQYFPFSFYLKLFSEAQSCCILNDKNGLPRESRDTNGQVFCAVRHIYRGRFAAVRHIYRGRFADLTSMAIAILVRFCAGTDEYGKI